MEEEHGGGGGVKLNRWGYEVNTCSDDCVSNINSYCNQVLSYGRGRRVILEAAERDKGCVLANILAAHYVGSTDSTSHFQAAKSRIDKASPYEKAVYEAISYLISEDRDDDVAFELHSKLLDDYPKDLASLKRAQVLCFYMGRPDLSLDLVLKVLPHVEGEDYVYGMLSFSLLELGRITEAEDAARKGYEINRNDYWAQHALCHVLQYQCRFREAVQFMEDCSPSWTCCSSFMLTHNWWHVALCYLEGNCTITKVVEVYDRRIWKELERDDATPPEVYLNALGLLLRLSVRGLLDVFRHQFKVLADRVSNRANWFLEWHLDVLIVWALVKSGEISKADDLLIGLKSRISEMNKKKQQIMQKVMQLAEALYEHAKGDDKRAKEILGPNFDVNGCKIIGASDEQLDVFNEVWFNILLNTGEETKAIEAIEKQINKRDGTPFTWRLLERAYRTIGSTEYASAAAQKARTLEAAYF
ncbi:Tetratricopeptide repeat protein 38 [Linum perenne]